MGCVLILTYVCVEIDSNVFFIEVVKLCVVKDFRSFISVESIKFCKDKNFFIVIKMLVFKKRVYSIGIF